MHEKKKCTDNNQQRDEKNCDKLYFAVSIRMVFISRLAGYSDPGQNNERGKEILKRVKGIPDYRFAAAQNTYDQLEYRKGQVAENSNPSCLLFAIPALNVSYIILWQFVHVPLLP